MTKAVLEAGSGGAAQRTAAAVPSPALAVPASLHASLMARLDRLGTPPHVADKILNHQAGTISGVAAVYQRHEFWPSAKKRWIAGALTLNTLSACLATKMISNLLSSQHGRKRLNWLISE